MILLVLGMHRSGTSAVTRTLSLMGAQIPGTLMQPASENPRGFWESREIMEIHDRFLEAVGSSWQDMRPLPDSAFQGPAARACQDELALLLGKALARSPLLAVKDPRLCRLMPLWRLLLRGLDEECRVVLSVRNPLEVAHSLKARNDIERERALTMWLVHSLLAERESRGMARCFVSYGALLASPGKAAAHLAKALGVFDEAAIEAALPAIETFWSKELRHHVQSDAALAEDPEIPAWVRMTYEALLTEPPSLGTLDEVDGEVRRAMESVETYLDPARLELPARLEGELSGLATEIDRLESRLSDAARTISERDWWLAEREALLQQRSEQARRSEAESETLRDRLQETLALLSEQTRLAAEKDALAARQSDWLREKDGEISRAGARIEAAERTLAEKDVALARQGEWLREKDGEITRSGGRIEALERVLAERDSDLARISAIAAEQAEQLTGKDVALARQGEWLRERDGEIARSGVRIEALGRALAEKDGDLARISATAAEQANQLTGKDVALARQAGQLEALAGELAERNERLAQAADAAVGLTARLGEMDTALAGALAGMAKQAGALTTLEDEYQALLGEAERSKETAAAREAELQAELASLRQALEEARASNAALGEERSRAAGRLETLGAAIHELEASLERQRDHLAVLAFVAGKRRG